MNQLFGIGKETEQWRRTTIALDKFYVNMHFPTDQSQAIFLRPFAHLITEAQSDADLNLFVNHGKSGEKPLKAWQHFENDSSDEKKLHVYNKDGQHLLYNHDSKVLTGYDSHEHTAYYYIPSLDMLPFYEKAAPMRMIFHHFAKSNGWSLVHGASIGMDGKGILLIGRGGSGKTTTALSAALAGFEYLGDDYVILNPKTQSILSLYASGKFRWDSETILHGIEKLAVNSKDEEKGYFFLNRKLANLEKKLTFSGLVIPSIGEGTETTFRRIPAAKALLVLASSTIFQMPGSGNKTLRNISDAIKNIPVYEMVLGNDTEMINKQLNELIKGL